MIRTLIVDDETLVRATLRTLLDWERFGYTVVQDCVDGVQAQSYLRLHPVDLLITDIKMPEMSGLQLLETLRADGALPVTVVLSSYDEFELVREAFRLGAYDYLLKSNLTRDSLAHLLEQLRQKIFADAVPPARPAHPAQPAVERGEYAVAVFGIDDFAAQAPRFGSDLHEKLEKPMLELVRQIQRLAGLATIASAGPDRYELRYSVRDKTRFPNVMVSVVRQIQAVWRDYMNVSVSAGISGVVPHTALAQAAAEGAALLKLAPLYGQGAICTQWHDGALAADYAAAGAGCDALIEAVCTGDDTGAETQKSAFLRSLKQGPADPGRRILVLLARMAEKLQDYGQSFAEIYPEKKDFCAELSALTTAGERELWLRNTLRRAELACARHAARQAPDCIQKAKGFIQDNYVNPELGLKTVADFVGLNEKYFSTRFAKECGGTFVAYLNTLRLQHARELLLQTDLKMYEISDRVGYSSVEHFNHTFKKKFGKNPSEYRKATEKT